MSLSLRITIGWHLNRFPLLGRTVLVGSVILKLKIENLIIQREGFFSRHFGQEVF